jgi:membrane-associated phospholipid phosphatase
MDGRKGIRAPVAGAVVFLLLWPGSVGAQSREKSHVSQDTPSLTLEAAGREFLRDAGLIWSSPARIRTRDIAPLLAIAAAAAFLVSADERTRDSVQGFADRYPWVGDVGRVVMVIGNEGAWGAAGAFFGLGLLLKDERAKETGYLAASAMAQAFLVDNVIKGLTGRQRPFYADGADHWWGPKGFFGRFESGNAGKFASFPSGHATSAFALATVIAHQYRRTVWVPLAAYAVATGVGLSRMALDRHWSSDVFCGAVLGHAVAHLVLRNHDRPRRLLPSLACSRRGIALTLVYDLGPSGF